MKKLIKIIIKYWKDVFGLNHTSIPEQCCEVAHEEVDIESAPEKPEIVEFTYPNKYTRKKKEGTYIGNKFNLDNYTRIR